MAVLTQQAVNAMRLSQSAAAVLRTIKGSYSTRLTEAEPFKSVGFNQTAILELNESKTIQAIEIVGNFEMNQIESISFEYQDGSEFSVLKPDMIRARCEFHGNYYEDVNAAVEVAPSCRFWIDFADTSYRTTDAIRRGELVVLPGETIRMKVRMKSKLTIGDEGEYASPDYLEIKANIIESPAQVDRYFVNRFSEMILDHNVSGEQTHKFPLMGIPHRIRRMYIMESDIEYLEIIRDRVKVLWGMKDAIISSQIREWKNPKSGEVQNILVIDFTQNGYATESAFVPVANESLQLKLRKTNAGPVRIVFEYITQMKDVPTTLQASA